MAFALFITPLLLAVDAVAYVQVPLYAPKPEAFPAFKKELEKEHVKTSLIVGDAPWYPYAMSIGVGTPPQTQSIVLTLSRGDSFVLWDDLCVPSTNPNTSWYLRNCSSSSFDDKKSSTFDYNSTDWYLGYFAPWQKTDSVMMWDAMRIGDKQLENATLGLAMKTELDTGFFGLGTPVVGPGQYVEVGRTTLLDQMANQNIIESPAFSIYADVRENVTGSIIFGAVDKSRYEGRLQRIDAHAGQRNLSEDYLPSDTHGTRIAEVGYIAKVSAAWRSGSPKDAPLKYVNSSSGGSFYASINPTFTFTNLPENVTGPLYDMIGNVGDMGNIGVRTVECSRADTITGNFTLELGGEGGYRLNASLKDLVVPPEVWHVLAPEWRPGREDVKHCFLGVQSIEYNRYFKQDRLGSETPWTIGSMMLRSTYTVFDTKNMEVSLAPLRKQEDAKPDIIPFESYGAHAPDSEVVGMVECFNKTCKKAKGKNGAQNVVAQLNFVMGLVLSSASFIMLI